MVKSRKKYIKRKNRKTYKHRRNFKRFMKGGKAIASGGFGCVFKPALKCLNKKKKFKGVSKLMLKKYSIDEYNEINKFKKVINKIKDNEKYFLLNNISICKPNKLSNDDLIEYNKCNNLIKKGITYKNINLNLNKLGLLQLPDGGIDLRMFFEKNITYKDIININNLLIELLKNGIIKMNKKKLYHFDIKNSNMLIKNSKIRLIDWGLADIQEKDEIPNNCKGRPFQFNLPFSCILFNSFFNEWYNTQLNNGDTFYNIAYKLIEYTNNYRGEGHFKYIKDIITTFKLDFIATYLSNKYKINIDNNNYYLNIIINYLVNIFEKYTNFTTNTFMDKKYFNEVFSKNVDIWGFLISYKPMIYVNNNNLKFIILLIINNYLFTGFYAAKPINIKKLISNLEYINNINNININIKNEIFTNQSLNIISLNSIKEKI